MVGYCKFALPKFGGSWGSMTYDDVCWLTFHYHEVTKAPVDAQNEGLIWGDFHSGVRMEWDVWLDKAESNAIF